MRWFGESWDSPVNEAAEQAPIPVGEICLRCHMLIEKEDQGVLIPHLTVNGGVWIERPYHRDCFLEWVLGPDWEKYAGRV